MYDSSLGIVGQMFQNCNPKRLVDSRRIESIGSAFLPKSIRFPVYLVDSRLHRVNFQYRANFGSSQFR